MERVFLSRKERRAFEESRSQARVLAQASSPVQDPAQLQHASAPESFAELIGGSPYPKAGTAVDTQQRTSDANPFAGLFDPTEVDTPIHAHGATQSDVRAKDARHDDARRGNEAMVVSRPDALAVSTQTGRVRLRPDELARATDSAPVPIALPTTSATGSIILPSASATGSIALPGAPVTGSTTLPTASATDEVSALFGGMLVPELPTSIPSSRRDVRAAAGSSRGKAKAGKAAKSKAATSKAATSKAATSKTVKVRPAKMKPVKTPAKTRPSTPAEAQVVAVGTRPEVRAKATRTRTGPAASSSRRSPLARLLAKAGIMVAALALVTTTAVPAYAQFDTRTWVDPSTGKAQTLAVGSVQSVALDKDDYAAHTTSAALDSTMGTVVAPEVQALAQQLMSAVQAGRLVGSTPDHIFEIRYLAQGRAVPGCGVDYRVLQAISFALTQFNTVGVSDINRHCTGQIEGAGTASAHYADGGGHAVDFYRLNGQALSGGDSASIKLIEALDRVVPTDSTVGQMECRTSLPLTHFKQIDDTCDHVHVDFLDAKGATLLG